MFELTVCEEIAAAHFLPGYQGKCRQLHGHNWKIEISIVAGQLDESGMVMDFKEVKKRLKAFLEHLDHVCFNDLPAFQTTPPTTENLAKYIFSGFSKELQPHKLKLVRVWESQRSCITYHG